MIKLVSFDIWKTLLDITRFYELIAEKLSIQTDKSREDLYKQIMQAYRGAIGARLRGEFKRPIYDSAIFFANKLGVSVDELFRATVQAVLDERIKNMSYPDAEPALSSLKEKNVKIAFLGNVMFWPGMITRIILERNNLLKYADITLFGDEIGVQKPDKEIFKTLAEQANCKIEEILHIGDSLVNDFAGALLAGAKAALIKRDIKEDIVVLNSNAYVINKLTAINTILNNTN